MAGTANVDRFRPTAADSKMAVFHTAVEGHAKRFVCAGGSDIALRQGGGDLPADDSED